jgi:hypothetical protein
VHKWVVPCREMEVGSMVVAARAECNLVAVVDCSSGIGCLGLSVDGNAEYCGEVAVWR